MTADAAILKLGQQGNIKQTNLPVISSHPDASGRLIVNQNHVVTRVWITRLLFLLLPRILPADESVLLAIVPGTLGELRGACTSIDADQEFLIGVGNRT